MARLRYLDAVDLAPEHRDVLARNINLNRVLAHSPNAARALTRLGAFIRFQSRLDSRLRELAILQVGYVARSAYEYSHHVEIARALGVSADEIRAIADESAGLPTCLEPLAKAVLRGAREMTANSTLTDATFAALRRELDEERVIDLVLTIAVYTGVVRLLAALQVDVEDEYRRHLDEFPLAAAPA